MQVLGKIVVVAESPSVEVLGKGKVVDGESRSVEAPGKVDLLLGTQWFEAQHQSFRMDWERLVVGNTEMKDYIFVHTLEYGFVLIK